MASGTRGKIREEMDGIHRNCEWIKTHCTKCLGLVTDDYPELQKSFAGLAEIATELDSFAQTIYSHV